MLLFELGAAVNAYGALIRAEVEESTVAEEAAAVAALDTLREARARVTELHLVDVREDMVTWELTTQSWRPSNESCASSTWRSRRAVGQPVKQICPTPDRY